MTEVAAHLVDRVIPKVPIRQVVASFPFRARVPLGYDAKLSRRTMAGVSTVLQRWLAWRAKRLLGLPSVSLAHVGGIAFQQRFDSSLRLNPHLHILVTDGVFLDQPGSPRFVCLPPPSPDELADLAARVHVKCSRIFAKHGRSFDVDSLGTHENHDLLAHLYSSAANTSPSVLRLALSVPCDTKTPNPLIAQYRGISIHAATHVPPRDRERLERLIRYTSRPPLALDRFSLRDDGRVCIRFKRPWKDGTRAVLLDPLDFIARLAALVPPPRVPLIRYFGVFAGHHRLRSRIVVDSTPPAPAVRQLDLLNRDVPAPWPVSEQIAHHDDNERRKRPAWAALLRRVFAFELEDCPCGGKMRIRSAHTTPDSSEPMLRQQGLWPDEHPRGPPTLDTTPAQLYLL